MREGGPLSDIEKPFKLPRSDRLAKLSILLSLTNAGEQAAVGTVVAAGLALKHKQSIAEVFDPVVQRLPSSWQDNIRRLNDLITPDTELQKHAGDYRPITPEEQQRLVADFNRSKQRVNVRIDRDRLPEGLLLQGTFSVPSEPQPADGKRGQNRTVFFGLSQRGNPHCEAEGQSTEDPVLHVVNAVVDHDLTRKIALPVIQTEDCIVPARFQIGDLMRGPHQITLFEDPKTRNIQGTSFLASILSVFGDPSINERQRKRTLQPQNVTLQGYTVGYSVLGEIKQRDPLVARRKDSFDEPRVDMPLGDYVSIHVKKGSSVRTRGEYEVRYYQVKAGEKSGTKPWKLQTTKGRIWDTDETYRMVIQLPSGTMPYGSNFQGPLHEYTLFTGKVRGKQAELQTCTLNNMVCQKIRTKYHNMSIIPNFTSFSPSLVPSDVDIDAYSMEESGPLWIPLSFANAVNTGRLNPDDRDRYVPSDSLTRK